MGKRPSEHKDPVVRWQRRIRNVRRRIYAWIAAGLTVVLLRVPYPILRPASRLVLTPMLRLLLGRTARRNLHRVFCDTMTPQQQREVLAQMFRNTATLLPDWVGLAVMGPKFLERHVDDEVARRRMHEFEAEWRGGWIGVTGHLGNWELLGQWGYQVGLQPMAGVVAKRQPNPHLNRLIERFRGRHGMPTLYRDDPPRKILRLLKSGHAVGIAGDQDVSTVAGVFIDFLGSPAYTLVGPARLALSAGVPIVVFAMLRRGDGYVPHVNAAIFPDRSRPREEEILRLTVEWSRHSRDAAETARRAYEFLAPLI